eukprot:8092227-Lingulodinium_polyedra.AAC.1
MASRPMPPVFATYTPKQQLHRHNCKTTISRTASNARHIKQQHQHQHQTTRTSNTCYDVALDDTCYIL